MTKQKCPKMVKLYVASFCNYSPKKVNTSQGTLNFFFLKSYPVVKNKNSQKQRLRCQTEVSVNREQATTSV
jgi:hypothetical protein